MAMPIPTARNPRLPALLGLQKLVVHIAPLFGKGNGAKGFKDMLTRTVLWLLVTLTSHFFLGTLIWSQNKD